MTMTTERRCACCETWTREYLAVCSDCHGERTEAICRLRAAERQVAAVREAFDGWDPEESPGHYDAIKRALEVK